MCKTYSVVACLVLGLLGAQLSLPAQAAGFQPIDISGTTFEFFHTQPGMCSFDVGILLNGKAGKIILPGGRDILTSPALKITLTNLSDTTKSVTLSSTGAFHQSFPNGNTVFVVTGRNILLDPIAGFVLAIGTFSFVFDASNNLIQPLMGTGQLVDICKLLA